MSSRDFDAELAELYELIEMAEKNLGQLRRLLKGVLFDQREDETDGS